ncbi:hypothetical protein ACTVCO_02120 [Sanguibacter sp. A247]|uniref:hypothetical protein n=1 Tax=unclassified Sanguibacter TaxID=2645534 RepID=UPI003FD752F6
MTETARRTPDTAPSSRAATRNVRVLAGVGALLTGLGGLVVLGGRALFGAHRYEQGGATLRLPVSGWFAAVDGALNEVEVPWIGLTEGESARLTAAYVLDALWLPSLLVLACVMFVRLAAGRAPSGSLRAAAWRPTVCVGVGQLVASVIAAALRTDVMPTISTRVLEPALTSVNGVAHLRADVEVAGSLTANLGMTGIVGGLVVVIAGLTLALTQARRPARPTPLPRRARESARPETR